MYKINISTAFYYDLIGIKNYIFRFSFSLQKADKVYDEIMANIIKLKIFPFMYPEYKNNIRVMTVRNKYRVFYKINEINKEVTIYYIFGTEENYNNLIH